MIESAEHLPDGTIQVIADGTIKFVPNDMGNADRRALDEWVAAGGEIAPLSVDLLAYAARKRWERETGGIEVAGRRIETDRDSQGLINGAFNLVQLEPDTTVQFKGADGFVTLDAATMTAIAIAVAKHVQNCFAIEAEVVSKITDGLITTTPEVDVLFD